ncbi:hypothetical protein BpHYR1_020025 [Brachionus plicatilis]|uniref:Uncharacterized protein n=1 Tax=Brachionus plicatilis TaxID=10195 RepID=A0A3M7QVL5_BRAPC|nr:hypothetical protein BpHYR1_020025 [Brachionus plicatilis]
MTQQICHFPSSAVGVVSIQNIFLSHFDPVTNLYTFFSSTLLQLFHWGKEKSRKRNVQANLNIIRTGFISKNLYTLGLSNAIDLPFIRIFFDPSYFADQF